jgi:hypothetical protein
MFSAHVDLIDQHHQLLLFSEPEKWLTLRLLVNKTQQRRVLNSLQFLTQTNKGGRICINTW